MIFGKFLLLFGCAICARAQLNPHKFEEFINNTIVECKDKEGASDNDIELLYNGDETWPSSREGKCFIECFFEEIGIVSSRGVQRSKLRFAFSSQFKNHKYYKRGFLAYSILVENVDEENSSEVAFFNNMINTINAECSNIKNPDRCDYAYEFAKCFDHVMGGVNDDRNVLFSDAWEHEKKN